MKILHLLLPVVFAKVAFADFAGILLLWVTDEDNYIIDSETTLNPGIPPSPGANVLAYWPSIETRGGDLIQTVAVSTNSDTAKEFCNGQPGQWCIRTANYGCNADGNTFCRMKWGDAVAMDADKNIFIRYTYDDSKQIINQTAFIDGHIISGLTTASFKPCFWLTAVECSDSCIGTTTSKHTYLNTTIVLAKADPKFGNQPREDIGTHHSNITSSDGGKTWKIDWIHIDEHHFAKLSSTSSTQIAQQTHYSSRLGKRDLLPLSKRFTVLRDEIHKFPNEGKL